METLPPELHLKIFTELSTNQLLCCRLVSREWNRRIDRLFGGDHHQRFYMWIDRQRSKDGLEATFKRLAKDLIVSRKSLEDNEELSICFGRNLALWDITKPLTADWDEQIQALERQPEVLDAALSTVQSLRIFGGFLSYRHLVLLLSHTPQLNSLRLVMGFDRSQGAWTLSASHRLKEDALHRLTVLDISDCTSGLDDRTLLQLTSHTPNLAVFNAAKLRSMIFYPFVHRRFYNFKVDENQDEEEYEVLKKVLRRPTTYGLTFAAVRAMLKLHTLSLTKIHLPAIRINADSVLRLLNMKTLTDIYLEGRPDAIVTDQILRLKQQQLMNKSSTQIHFEASEETTT